MIINYNYKIERDHYTIYGCPSFKNTNVFHEYYDVIMRCPDVNKAGLTEMIKTFKPLSKAGIRITYGEDRIEFFRPNKYIFPEFYIEFRELDITIDWKKPSSSSSKSFPVTGYIADEIGQFDPNPTNWKLRNLPSRPQFDPKNYISGLDNYKEDSDGKGSSWRVKKKN